MAEFLSIDYRQDHYTAFFPSEYGNRGTLTEKNFESAFTVRFIGHLTGYDETIKGKNNETERKEAEMEYAVLVMAVMDLVPIAIGVLSAAIRAEKKREPDKAE